jgi:large subunit ribosomal protein L30
VGGRVDPEDREGRARVAVASKLKITYVKSSIGYAEDQKGTVRALGLRKLHQSVEQADSSAIRGMIHKVRHLVLVEPVEGASQEEES